MQRQGKSGSAPFFGNSSLLVVIAALTAGILVRSVVIDHVSADYIRFFGHWYDIITRNGGFYALGERFSNSSPPYLYLLTIAAWLPIKKIYAIKLISFIFDLVLAWFAYLTALEFSKSRLVSAIAFACVFLAPTVMINSAMWGQCDSIYSAFLIAMIYFLLRRNSFAAVVMWSLAFSFKQQSIFLFPVLLIFMLRGRIQWKHLLIIPVVYAVMMLPAYMVGHPPMQLLTIYIFQAGTYTGLAYHAPNFYGAIGNIRYDYLSMTWIVAAAVMVITVGWFSLRSFFAEAGRMDGLLKFAFILILIPPVLTFLRPFGDLLLLFVRRPSTYQAISSAIPGSQEWLLEAPQTIGAGGIAVALVIVGLFCYIGSRIKTPLINDPGALITISLMSALLVPFMLVRMHERYFYPADVISILFAIRYPRYFYIPLIVISVSLFSYCPFILGMEIVPIPVLSIVIGLVIVMVATRMGRMFFPSAENDR